MHRSLSVVLGALACTPSADTSTKGGTGSWPTDPYLTPTTPTFPVTTPTTAICDPDPPASDPVAVSPTCAAEPPVGVFDPVTEWTWRDNPVLPTYHQVVVTPAVVDLTGDGLPEIVFVGFEGIHYGAASALTAIDGRDGTTVWSAMDVAGFHPRGTGGVAVGDLDGDGAPEIVVTALEGLLCVDATGAFRWMAAIPIDSSAMPAIGDLEGDGFAEVVVGRSVVEHDGAVRWTGTAGQGGAYHVASFPADLDGDGLLEVVAGNTVYEHDGAVRWSDGMQDGKPGVADLDGDGSPEIVRVYGAMVQVDGADGTLWWTYPLPDLGGGAPTIADFDGDGRPDIGVASASTYRALDGDGVLLWEAPTEDHSSAMTGSSAFDLEGDGALEILYADEHTFWVFDGATGAVRLAWPHGSGTLHEYPVPADVDGDGSAEIVVASNDYAWGESRGISVIGSASSSWRPARPVWNQHAYAITNVDDDGSVPTAPAMSWATHGTFRAGDATAPTTPLPDLQVGAPTFCADTCASGSVEAWFPVANAGPADAPPTTFTLGRTDGSSLAAPRALAPVPSGSVVWVGPIVLDASAFSAGLADWVAAVDAVPGDCDAANDAWQGFPADPCAQ